MFNLTRQQKHAKGYQFITLFIVGILLIQVFGSEFLFLTQKLNYCYRQFIDHCNESYVILTFDKASWNVTSKKEIVLSGQYFDVESFTINADGSVSVKAIPDAFDSLIGFFRNKIHQNKQNNQPGSPINPVIKSQPTLIFQKSVVKFDCCAEKNFIYPELSLNYTFNFLAKIEVPPKSVKFVL